MTFTQLIQYIAAWIYTNHNNEITAVILQDVLDKIAEYSRDNYDALVLVDQDLQDQIDNININVGLTVHTGATNPNITPPSDPYSAPDFYLQNNGTIWVYDGTDWINLSDNLVNSRIADIKIDEGDLSSNDIDGVVDYFSNLIPPVMKDANDDWIISVIDGSGEATMRFVLVDIGKGLIGTGETQLTTGNLIPLGGGGKGQLIKVEDDIASMLADQANQIEQQLIEVEDASADINLTFPQDETRRQAFYKYNGVATGSIDDYTLISAPYGVGGSVPGINEVLAVGNTAIDKTLKLSEGVNSGDAYLDLDQDVIIFGLKDLLGTFDIIRDGRIILNSSLGTDKGILDFRNSKGNYILPQKVNGQNYTIATTDDITGFTTQIIDSGGNYNDLEVTADLLVFTNENAQAILNGVWGRKEFHILNLSSQYEILINHDSSSVSGNGQPIMLPTNSGTAGIKGTARVLQTDSYGYFVADTWGSKYRPEFSELTEDKVMLVGADHRAKAEDIIELKFYRTNQSTAMDSAELENEYPDSIQGTEVICTPINKKYEKINNLGDWVEIDFVTV